MDELHLSHHFGRSFRPQFKSLKTLIFNKSPHHTPILLMTATCSFSIVETSETLFGCQVNAVHWSTNYKMANRNQSFLSTYSPIGIRYVKKILSTYLTMEDIDSKGEVLPSKLMFYANTAVLIKGLSET